MLSSKTLAEKPGVRSLVGRERYVPLTSNFYSITLKPRYCVHVYTLSFNPMIPPDSNRLRSILVHKSSLKTSLGQFVQCGDKAFVIANLTKKIGSVVDTIVEDRGTSYDLRATFNCILDLNERNLDEETLHFINNALKCLLKQANLVQVGGRRSHFDMRQVVHLESLSVWPGIFNTVGVCEAGLLMKADIVWKIIRQDSVLAYMKELIDRFPRSPQTTISEELIGNIVMTDYGNNNFYRIVEVIFDENPSKMFDTAEGSISYVDYYWTKYHAKILDLNQPLLLARRGSKNTPCVKLMPELCRLVGLSENMRKNETFKMALIKQTRLNPAQRQSMTAGFVGRLSQAANETENWPITVETVPMRVKGIQLEPPTIDIQGEVQQVQGSFRVGSVKELHITEWAVFFVENDQACAESFARNFKRTAENLGLLVSFPRYISVPFSRNAVQTWTTTLLTNIMKSTQVVVCLMPHKDEKLYSAIKKVVVTDRPRPCQIVNKKSVSKIPLYVNIILQVCAKLGDQLWRVQMPVLPEHTMIIGYDVNHDTVGERKSILGFCATLNSSFTKYYSRVGVHASGAEVSTCLKPLLIDAFKKFYILNGKRKPQCLVIYRDGVGISQTTEIVQIEKRQITQVLQAFDPDWNPQIVFILVNKRIKARFYAASGGNLPAGVVVNSDVVGPHYNFYLSSHNANQGTVTPTHYNVLVNDSSISQATLERLTFCLCFNYFNWTGGISVPAPCQYAHKLAYLIGQSVRGDFNKELQESLFYL